jgi:hypothetical protein
LLTSKALADASFKDISEKDKLELSFLIFSSSTLDDTNSQVIPALEIISFLMLEEDAILNGFRRVKLLKKLRNI